MLALGTKTVVSTISSRGALIATQENVKIVSGYKVKAVDTVAAGDSFNGAFAVALTEGKTLQEAVRFANAMGALTVTEKGAIPSLHTRKQVEEFILNNSKIVSEAVNDKKLYIAKCHLCHKTGRVKLIDANMDEITIPL